MTRYAPQQGEVAKRPPWPEETAFQHLPLDVESDHCEHCGRGLHVCDHRFHTLQGPLELVCRLAHCSDRACPAHHETLSPAAEFSFTLPWWLIGWDVFCWLRQRRFARHRSIPQLQDELQEDYHIDLSKDTLRNYLRRYQTLVAARQQDPQQLAQVYRRFKSLVLTIDDSNRRKATRPSTWCGSSTPNGSGSAKRSAPAMPTKSAAC